MERRIQKLAQLGAGWAIAAVLGIALMGCGQESSAPAAGPMVDARGEPIRGEPIVQPQPVAAAEELPLPSSSSSSFPAAAESAGGPGADSAASAASAAAPAPAPHGTSQHPVAVGFDKLASFQYTLPDGPVETNAVTQTQAPAPSQIPVAVQALNNQFISLKGFMLPLKVEKGLVTELLILRDQSMCCYGSVPRINEWVSVKMVGEGVKPIMDQAVTLFGKLKVGEMYENGYLVGIYALDGERMAGPLDL